MADTAMPPSPADTVLLTRLFVLTGADPECASASAQRLLQTYGTLRRVWDLPAPALQDAGHLGPQTAVLIPLLRELERRRGAECELSFPNCLWQDLRPMLMDHCLGQDREHFYVICLDAGGRLLSAARAETGTRSTVSLSPCRAMACVARSAARQVILVHNHPDGACRFSVDDYRATFDFARLLQAMHVELTDHLLVADRRMLSMKVQARRRRHRFPSPFSPPV